MLSIAKDYVPYESKTPVWYPGVGFERPVGKKKNSPSMKKASTMLGKASNYFSCLKRQDYATYKLILDFGEGDLYKGWFELKNYLNSKEDQLRIAIVTAKRISTITKISKEYFGIPNAAYTLKNRATKDGVKTIHTARKIESFYEFVMDKEREYEEDKNMENEWYMKEELG